MCISSIGPLPEFVGQAAHAVGKFIFDFQTLITGVAALIAAYFAGAPVWRELKNSNLQTRMLHRETLAGLMRDAHERSGRVANAIGQTLADADYLTSDPLGEPIPIKDEDAFHLEQRLQGTLDWYLVTLKGTEGEDIEAAKQALSDALSDLTSTLSDAHWPGHNDQHSEDRSFSDAEWAEILERSKIAETLAAEKVSAARTALSNLLAAQNAWIASLRARIAHLDREIAAS